MVAETAKAHLQTRLATYPQVVDIITKEPNWNRWVELCRDRCNQLDIYLATKGKHTTKHQWLMFIEDAVTAYGRRVLDTQQEYLGLTK